MPGIRRRATMAYVLSLSSFFLVVGAQTVRSERAGDASAADAPKQEIGVAADSATCFPSWTAVASSTLIDGGFGVAPRFIAFTAGDPNYSQAIRVTFPDRMPAPYWPWSALEMWLAPPQRYCENGGVSAAPVPNIPPNYGCDAAPGLPQRWYMASTLQCEPHYQDWAGYCDLISENKQCVAPSAKYGEPCSTDSDCDSSVGAGNGACSSVCVDGMREDMPCVELPDCRGEVYVFHEGIIPSGGPHNEPTIYPTTYTVQVIEQACSTEEEADYSSPLAITTSKWGDTVQDMSVSPFPPPEGIVQITDVLAILSKFRNLDTAGVSARVDLYGASAPKIIVDHGIDIGDVLQALFAFQAMRYPPCPMFHCNFSPRPCGE